MEMLIALTVFVAVTSLFVAVFTRPPNQLRRRLETFREMAILEEAPTDKEPGFMERVLRPVFGSSLRAVRMILPPSMLERLQWRLTVAGDPVTLTAMLTIWAVAAFGLPALYFLTIISGGKIEQMQLLLMGSMMALGAFLPHLWLKRRTDQRKKTILKRLPDAIDLLVTCVEAGLGIDAALGQVAEKIGGPISQELRRTLREMAVGSSRRDALKALAERTQVPDVKAFVNALIQAEEMGVSLATVIRIQADQMRTRRRQRAEEQAHKAPVKITIPLVLFIFPTIMVVILGPAFIQIKNGLG
ncbi:MAG: type II secretion system F family protein [Chloroflexi bacterium]|nr:type II secretion system F family protein [Chloroflexota bacterium]